MKPGFLVIHSQDEPPAEHEAKPQAWPLSSGEPDNPSRLHRSSIPATLENGREPPLPGIKAEEKMAERLGFEPRDPLRSQWFSKPSRSAAPASLRWNSFDQWFTANCAKLPGSLSRTPEKTLGMVLPPGGKKINPGRHWSSPDRHGLRLPGASA